MIEIEYRDPVPIESIKFEVAGSSFRISHIIGDDGRPSGSLRYTVNRFYSCELREIAENLIAAADVMDAGK